MGGCGPVAAGVETRGGAGAAGAAGEVEEAGSPWRAWAKRQSVNLQFPLFQKNRQTPYGTGVLGVLGVLGALGVGLLLGPCRNVQVAPRRQPAGVLKKLQTLLCDMVPGFEKSGDVCECEFKADSCQKSKTRWQAQKTQDSDIKELTGH